jgi:ABC transport system ATP-binding/permease protein
MSEPVLKAILRLFALVAKEDQITETEQKKVEEFLSQHLNERAVKQHLQLFDSYAELINYQGDFSQEKEFISQVCDDINKETEQRQKSVVLLELMNIILADGSISEREQNLAAEIAKALNTRPEELQSISHFVLGADPKELDHENILIVDSTNNNYGKCKKLKRDHLDGFISILYLKDSDIFFIRYFGRTDVFLNGVPHQPGNINVLAAGSMIRWENGQPVYYGEVLSCLKEVATGKRLSFEAKHISYKFRSGKLGLREIDVFEETGNLIALMGASGAGKSTLLHVLNGTEAPSSGKVLINGIDIHQNPKSVKGIIGFVPQDDLLVEDLTVYQNLFFAAKLCFNHYSAKQIHKLITKTLNDLGLLETKDLKVGSPLQKTISGGQRKRLNIGLELLREPSVLFVDEPTSGLSSRDSENIIDLLKELSLKGKLVFAVIHQPSSDIFKMFDKLVILDTGGYQIFYGNPVDAVTYFKQCIHMVNSEQGECHVCGNVNPEQIFNIIETKVINEFGNFTNERKFTPEQWNKKFKENIKIKPVEQSKELPENTLSIPNRLKQSHLFGLRDLLSKISNKQYLIINLLEAPVLAFILAFITRFYNVDDQYLTGYVFSKNLNLPAYLFMSIIVALFMGLTVSAEEIIRDRKILKREKFLSLSRSSYLISKTSILFLLSAFQTASFVLVGNWILGIQDMFLLHWGILFTVSCFANLLGLNISSAFNSAVTIYILIPILLIPQLILSGVVVKFDKLNPVIGNTATVPFVGDLMASRWAFEAAMVTQFKDNEYEKNFYILDKIMADADYKKVYFIPELESKLDFINLNYKSSDAAVRSKVTDALILVENEIDRELEKVGKEHFKYLDRLTLKSFDSVAYTNSMVFLETLKRFYTTRYNKADQQKEKQINAMTNTAAQEKQFETYKLAYTNEAIADLVKNTIETNRIIEQNGKFVQKIFPIYKDPDPNHLVDFDAQFYMPKKHFLNVNIDTYYFNCGVIWVMTVLLILTLYFDVLRKIVDGLGNMGSTSAKRM